MILVVLVWLSLFVLIVQTAPTSPKHLKLDFEVHARREDGSLVKRGTGAYASNLKFKSLTYTTYLQVGSKKQSVGVNVDTGSSDLWIPNDSAPKAIKTLGYYSPSSSSTFQQLGIPFDIGYSDTTTASGTFVRDTVGFGNTVSIKNYQFASVGDTNVTTSGILGLGLYPLEAPVNYGYGIPYVNFPLALKQSGYISTAAYSVYLSSPQSSSGSIIFGGKDLSKISGDLVKLPHSGKSTRFTVTLESITSTGKTIPVGEAFVLDSGTYVSQLPGSQWLQLVKTLGGDGTSSSVDPLFAGVSCLSYYNNGVIGYNFDGVTVNVPLSSLVKKADDGTCYITFVPATGLIYVLGDDFLNYAYCVFNAQDGSIEIGQALFNNLPSNIVTI